MTDTEQRVDALFGDLFRMTDTELRLLRLGWSEVPAQERLAAWQKVSAALRRPARAELMESARSTLTRWVSGYLSATAAEYGSFLINPGSGMDPLEVRSGAIAPVLDAVAAIIAEDVLTDGERETLLAPWARLTVETDQ